MHTYTGTLESRSTRSRFMEAHDSSGRVALSAPPSNYPVLATPHLRLRPFELSDISRVVEIANEHHVVDATVDVPLSFTRQHARGWIESHAAAWERRQSLHWAVSILADDSLIGYTGLHDIDLEDRRAELSFWIGRGAERRGYATEATQAALAFAFATLKLDRINAFHLESNLLGAKVLAKIGMMQEAALRQQISKWNQFEDIIVRGISKSGWLASL